MRSPVAYKPMLLCMVLVWLTCAQPWPANAGYFGHRTAVVSPGDALELALDCMVEPKYRATAASGSDIELVDGAAVDLSFLGEAYSGGSLWCVHLPAIAFADDGQTAGTGDSSYTGAVIRNVKVYIDSASGALLKIQSFADNKMPPAFAAMYQKLTTDILYSDISTTLLPDTIPSVPFAQVLTASSVAGSSALHEVDAYYVALSWEPGARRGSFTPADSVPFWVIITRGAIPADSDRDPDWSCEGLQPEVRYQIVDKYGVPGMSITITHENR